MPEALNFRRGIDAANHVRTHRSKIEDLFVGRFVKRPKMDSWIARHDLGNIHAKHERRRSRGSVAAWVATITRTRALDLVRSRKRRARVLEEAAVVTDEGEALVLAPTLETADRGAELSETSTIVRRSIAGLSAPQRRVIELAYFGGFSQSEIAAQLSEPLGTVKTRMRAAMEKLRQALRPVIEADA